MIRWFGDMSRAKALNGWELLESRRLLALTDPIGDADQDLVFAEVVAVADELEITVRFAAGTFDMAKSNLTVSLDTDQDASTGHPGIDSGGTIDGEILGSEFIISNSGVDRSAARLLAYTGPPINTFSFRDSQPITFLRDGIRVRFPLASLDRDDGLVNFKVTSSEQLDDTGSTGILDVMPDVGLAPGSSEIESSFVLYGTTVPNGDNADSLVRLEPATGAQKLIGAAGASPGTTSIDWNPATGTLFGVDESQSPGVISEINPATGIATPLATILDQRTPARITNVSFSPDGAMWGSVGDTSIGTIDLISQEYKPVIAAPNGEFILGMDISPDGTLYIAHSNLGAASQTLTSIDLATTEILNELSIGSLNVDDIDFAPDGFIYHTNFSFALVRLDPSTGQQTIVGFGDLSALAGIASTSINGPPAITSNPFASVPENTISVMTVTVTDPDGDTPVLSISGGADAASFTIGNSNGVLNFASAPDFEKPADADGNNVYEVQVTADDGHGGTNHQLISVTVTPVNERPDLRPLSNQTMDEGTTHTVNLSATDPDGDVMALSVDGLPSFGSLTDNGDGTGALVFDPHFVDDGIYTISVTVADRGLPSLADSESFTLTVRDVTDTRAVDLQVNTSSSSGGTRGVAVVEGATLDYTITVSNNGPRDITGAVVADTFPAELSSVAWTAAVTTGTGNVSANGSGDINESFNLTSGSVITFNVRGTVVGSLAINQAAAKIVTNTFTVTAPAGIVDSDPSNNSATDSDIVVLAATGGSGIFSASNNRLGIANSFDVSLGDVDGDGDLDAFVANFFQPSQVWLNDGRGGFSASSNRLGSAASRGVSLGDLDGDGDLDAFVANGNGQPNRVWLNDGRGNFSASNNSLGNSASLGVSLGDVDGDGDLDAFVVNAFGQPNRVWLNDGRGNFSASSNRLGSSASLGVSLGDVDGDGDLDAFVANYNQPNRVWLNDGRGNFLDSSNALGSSASLGVSLGDLDGDGDLDAFVANADGQGNRVWLNDGRGSFSASNNSLGSSQSSGVSLGDVDSDGDLDAYVTNINQPDQVWLNDSLGNFSARSNRLGSSASLGVSLGDVDGDGDLDAFVANFFQPNQVWLNQNSADLRITKTAGMLAAAQGTTLTYTINITNNGPQDVAGARVADSYPVELSDVTWTTVISGSGDVSASGSGDINEDINLTRGSLVTFTVSGTVVDRSHTTSGTRVGSLASGAAVARIVTHAASVTVPAGTVDSDPSNDIATGSDVVVLEPVAVDDDRVVGFSDFVVLATNFGRETDVGMAGGDFDGNGIVDHADFSALAESFGRKVHPALSAFRPDAADEAFSVGIEIEMANSIDDELLDDLLT